VLHDDLADLVERKAGDLVRSAVESSTFQACDDLSGQFAPAEIPTNQSFGLDIIQYSSTSEFMDSGGPIVGRSWLIVKSPSRIDYVRLDTLLCKEECQKKSSGTCADNQNLGKYG